MLAKIRCVKLPNTCQKSSCSVIYFDSKTYADSEINQHCFYFSLFASGASHYGPTNLTPHSPSEAKSGYPYFGQLTGMEAGMVCGRVH